MKLSKRKKEKTPIDEVLGKLRLIKHDEEKRSKRYGYNKEHVYCASTIDEVISWCESRKQEYMKKSKVDKYKRWFYRLLILVIGMFGGFGILYGFFHSLFG